MNNVCFVYGTASVVYGLFLLLVIHPAGIIEPRATSLCHDLHPDPQNTFRALFLNVTDGTYACNNTPVYRVYICLTTRFLTRILQIIHKPSFRIQQIKFVAKGTFATFLGFIYNPFKMSVFRGAEESLFEINHFLVQGWIQRSK